MRRLFAPLGLILIVAFAGLMPLVATTSPALAQEVAQLPDFESWEKVASRAEVALANKRASSNALEDLRAELVSWRAIFLAAESFDQTRLETLRTQLSTLGPAPEEGTEEPAEISTRREVLQAQISAIEAPQLSAKEAFSRAGGLIRETDEIIRNRQTAKLLTAGPSPLNPALWAVAIDDLSDSIRLANGEFSAARLSQTRLKKLREGLPATLFYLVMAFVLSLRGRFWMERLTARIHSRPGESSRRLAGFLTSTGQVILPVAGVFLLTLALHSTGLLGARGQIVADGLPVIGFGFFLARWLSLRLFPTTTNRKPIIELPAVQATQARRSAAGLGLLWGIGYLLGDLAAYDHYSDATRAVLDLPVIVLSGFLLYGLGRVLRYGLTQSGDAQAQTDSKFHMRALNLTGRALLLVGIAGPLIAAIGFHTAALAIVFPTVATLALLGLLYLLSGAARDAYSLLTGDDEERTKNALIPVLVSFALVIGAIPLLALIWGARVSDLAEIWTKIGEGFLIGDTRISPTQLIAFAIVFVVGYGATKMLQSTLRGSVLPKTKIDPGGQVAIVSGVGYVGIFLAAVIAISTAGINLSSLAIVAGALSVGIGFGLQNIVSNFVSGIILLIERPISEGDWIEVGGNMGTVREISVRSTRIETFDRTDLIIPNSDLVSSTVTNFTRGNLTGRIKVSVGVAYGTDTRKVQQVLTEIAEAHPMVLKNPAPSVHFVDFGADSLDFQIRAILGDINNGLTVKTEIRHEIVRRFAEENFEIPFAQRDVWLRNPEALHPPAPKPPVKSTTKSTTKSSAKQPAKPKGKPA